MILYGWLLKSGSKQGPHVTFGFYVCFDIGPAPFPSLPQLFPPDYLLYCRNWVCVLWNVPHSEFTHLFLLPIYVI